ncbi:competence type IV pilus major pilin ComGC [Gracilibacillus marinus]|jgi:competence protein ComGC|uniref:ComG operon protein 3 n=1 Tax=Gracilibacillus marinus TaxID=630535 RepID=A0ABV8W0C5_9BACI
MAKNEKGFTLIEMIIVLAVISILMILFIPNLASKNDAIQEQGCDALITLAENQLIAYELEKGAPITAASDLVTEDYLKTKDCANGTKELVYHATGEKPFTAEAK